MADCANLQIETVAVVGAGLADDWLLSYQFQQVFCEQAVETIIKSDLSLVAIVKKADTTPFVQALHAEIKNKKTALHTF